MNLLNKPARIKESLSLTFHTTSGWYLISVSARVKSEKQRGENETDDEDLTVKIDEKTFPHPSSKGQLKDSPAAFSGGQLHNKLKIVYFITHLASGDHRITLNPQYGAEVEEVSYEKIAIEDPKINLSIEKQAEKANGGPWITFVLDGLSLASITAKATVEWRFPDGDDVKLIVDGKTKKNPRSIRHKNWIWASNILHKIFGGATREKEFDENLPTGLHYIEFHADESPVLHHVTLDLGESPLPRAMVTMDGANLREGTSQESLSLLTFDAGDVVEVLQKVIEGEAPYEDDGNFTNIWHKVRFGETEGYIFSEAVEIDGGDQDTIEQLIIEKAKEISVDPQIAVALGSCESQLFPYKISSANARGLFQLTPNLTVDLNDESKEFYSPVNNPFNIPENIAGGLSYFKYLYNKYSGDYQQLEKAIAAYNAGTGNVPEGKMDLNLYDFETRRLVSCVKSYNEENKSKKNN